jgi:hypothetical protein
MKMLFDLKKIIAMGTLAAIASNCLTGCSSRPLPVQETEPSETGTENIIETGPEEPIPEFSIEALESLDGVTRVEDITVSPGSYMGSQNPVPYDQKNYIVYFEQPLDWNDPSKGTFEQRVSLIYTGADVNEFYVGGYYLNDNTLIYANYMDSYAVSHVVNYISAEYRFFGQSKPEDLDNHDPKYWDCLTSYNAACDFHHIITELKKVLPAKWMMTGASKGGIATMVQSMYFPEDANVFVPQIAPVMSSPQEDCFMKNIYETIGNDRYGPELAAEYRKLVLDLQVEAIKNRDELQDRCCDYIFRNGETYTDIATPEIIYDYLVHGFAIRTWQYAQDFDSIRAALEMKDEDGYTDELYYLLTGDRPAGDEPYVINGGAEPLHYDYYPYYVQCMKELGYFRADFSYLREALEAEGSGAGLAVTEDMEDMLSLKLFIQPEVLETLSFDRSLHDDLITWSQTTDSNVIVLFGGSDVWYPLRLPDVPDRENYHTFVDDLSAHGHIYARIDLYSRYDIQELIDEALRS